MLRPIQAIWWREWRETWYYLPMAVLVTLMGGVMSAVMPMLDSRANPVMSNEAFLVIGAGAGLMVIAQMLLNPRNQQFALPLAKDLLYLPISPYGLAVALLTFRLVYFVFCVLVVQALCVLVFPDTLAGAAAQFESRYGAPITYAGVLWRTVAFLLLTQGLAWSSSPYFALFHFVWAMAIAGFVPWYFDHAVFNDPGLLSVFALGGLALCFTGIRAMRRKRLIESFPSLPRMSTKAAPAFRHMSPLRAQCRYEYRLYGRWYALAAPCVVVAFTLTYGLWILGPHLGVYLKSEQFLLFQFQHQANAFLAGALLLCTLLGFYIALNTNAVFKGRSGRYALTLPLHPRTAANARVLVVLSCIGIHVLWAGAAMALYMAVAVALGAQFEWSWVPEGLATISAELLHGLVIASLTALLPWVFFPVAVGAALLEGGISWELLPVPIVRALQTAVILSPWAFILHVLLRRGGVTRAQIIRGAAATTLLAVLYLVVIMAEAPGAIPPIAALAIAAMPVTAYFFWHALFTRMRGR